MNKKNKKLLTILIAIIITVVVILCGFFVLNAVAINKYWSAPADLSAVIEHRSEEEYRSDLEEIAFVYDYFDDLQKELDKYIKTATPLTGCDELLDSCNNLMIDYFKNEYGVDVTKKLSKLNVYLADWPADTGVYGGYFVGTDNIYFCTELFEQTEDISNQIKTDSTFVIEDFAKQDSDFVGTYIHEAVHYLGFCDEENEEHEIIGFCEGITEYITREITAYYDITYSGDAYPDGWVLGEQIISCDDDLIYNVLTSDNFDYFAYISSIIGEEYTDEYSAYFDLVTMNFYGTVDDHKFMAQYFTYELLKSLDVYEKPDDSIVNFFELKLLFN